MFRGRPSSRTPKLVTACYKDDHAWLPTVPQTTVFFERDIGKQDGSHMTMVLGNSLAPAARKTRASCRAEQAGGPHPPSLPNWRPSRTVRRTNTAETEEHSPIPYPQRGVEAIRRTGTGKIVRQKAMRRHPGSSTNRATPRMLRLGGTVPPLSCNDTKRGSNNC